MKTRTAIGGAIIAAAIVGGAFLGQWLPKFGTGTGLGTGSGTGAVATPDMGDIVTDASQRAANKPTVEAPQPAPEAESNVLEVRIDGRNYEVSSAAQRGGPQFRRISLEELVALAKKHAGDERGIRVRVSRMGTAKPSAEVQLRDELVNAGLSSESIDWGPGPAP